MKYLLYLLLILTNTILTNTFISYSHKIPKKTNYLYGMKGKKDIPGNGFNKKIGKKSKENNLLGLFDYKILEYLKKKSSKKYVIINKKNKKIYDIENINKKIKQNQIISISPGGIQGFYFMGIMSFIKEYYDLQNIIFTGASAGAWISLFSSYKYNTTKFVSDILNCDFSNIKSIIELQITFKNKIMQNYHYDDFNLENIFIGVTVLKGFELTTNIFYNFENLEDAIDCCIASSHIPFLTGGIINKYNNEISFDGGFSNSPYLKNNNTILNINPSLWNEKEIETDFIDYHELTMKNNHNFTDLYYKGYNNAKKNNKKLEKIFNKKIV